MSSVWEDLNIQVTLPNASASQTRWSEPAVGKRYPATLQALTDSDICWHQKEQNFISESVPWLQIWSDEVRNITDRPVVLTYGHLSRDLVKPSINSPSPGTAGAGLSHCWSHSRYTGTRNIPLLTALASSALAAQAHTCAQNPCSTAGPQTCVFQMLLFAELNAALLGWTAFSSVLVLHF